MKSQRNGEEEIRTLFRLRMQREGREAELDQRFEQYRTDGKSRRQAICAAMRDMGYESPRAERKKWRIAKGQAFAGHHQLKQRDCQKRYQRRMRNKALDEVMDQLKPNAPPEQEMDWVTSHRKLFTVQQIMSEAEDPNEGIAEARRAMRLTGDDIKTAPSQAAVAMLYTAMKDPDDWMKKKRDAHKSKTSAGSGSEDDKSDASDDLGEVERLLKAAMGNG